MDLSVTLKGQTHDLTLKNPVLTASGTFGYGLEFASYGDLAALGGMVAKGLSLLPRQGNATPRIVETTAGMLNAVGLQNDGVESFLKNKLPRLPWHETPVIANLYATSPAEFAELAGILAHEITHVTAKHHLLAIRKTAQSGMLTQLLASQIKTNAVGNMVASQFLALGRNLYARGLDQTDEFHSDRNGVALAARAGRHRGVDATGQQQHGPKQRG